MIKDYVFIAEIKKILYNIEEVNMTEKQMNIGKELDKVLYYVSEKLLKTSNPKPVLLHSFKVAYRLLNYGYDRDLVISGALHDLIEDTDITYNDIKEKYGKKIADIVLAVSYNKDINDKYTQSIDMFNRCLQNGFNALIVKCSDLCDNIDFIPFTDKKKELLKKYELFLNLSEEIIGKEEIYQELLAKYQTIK